MSFSGGKGKAMNLLYQLIIYGVTQGFSSKLSCDGGPGKELGGITTLSSQGHQQRVNKPFYCFTWE